jgi:nitrate/nitrite transport system substrate-binding protein
VRSGAWAAGSDAPEKKEVRIGFIPLTDCASVVMAAVQKGFDEKYGIKIIPTKEASWAGVRDKLVNGELDAAHVLYGLIYGVHLGIGGRRRTWRADEPEQQRSGHHARQQAEGQGRDRWRQPEEAADAKPGEYTFAQTFPTGTHAMWLYYWLAAHGINPMKDVKTITVPPPQMVANMRVGNMDGFCVGEPWNNRAIMTRSASPP